MKIRVLNFIIFIFICTLVSSCDSDDKNDECIQNEIGYVTTLTAPSSGSVNETINIEVNFRVFNGCGKFGKFMETENGNTRTIEVEAKYEGCNCTQDAPIRTTNYEFVANSPGNYTLKFKSSPTEFITVNLVIK
ncbi:hypothetical protein ACG2LH_08455 [Zhouia sp. PK063]|uniref:hypothetical protein n=1 Tax=Zhouia sp. PK063 TaxID=3373602 RepID=UPI0037BA28C3